MKIAPLLAGLNPEQHRAVTSTRTRILTIAGAGAGKTHVLSRRILRLLAEGVPGELILAVTFTNKAAEEMQERVNLELAQRFDVPVRGPEVRTLHAWGARLIRLFAEHFGLNRDFTVYDDTDHEDVLRQCARDRGVRTADTAKLSTLWRDEKLRRDYYDRLRAGNAIDFDMIEDYTLRLLQEHPDAAREWTGRYRHVLVDEYQDTNLAQVAIVGKLSPPNLFIVGDPRQSIYRFRGAEVQTIVDHARDADFEVIELTTNYRSVPAIVAYGNGCVDGAWTPMESGRQPRHSPDCEATGTAYTCPVCLPELEPPTVTAHTYVHEPPVVAHLLRGFRLEGRRWGDMAVLARNWAALDAIREHLDSAGIPCNYTGVEDDPWEAADGRAVARALMLAANPQDDNLAALLSEWGCMGARRFDGLGALRARALRARRTLLEELASESEPWRLALPVLRAAKASATTPAGVVALVGAVVDALGVRATYTERALRSRLDTIRELGEEILRRGLSLEAFREWWISRGVAERLKRVCRACNGSATGCSTCSGTGKVQAVDLCTVHGAKGLEWPVVIGADVRAGVFPTGRMTATDEDRAEDLRVFYVLVTRARDRLALVYPRRHRPPYGGPVETCDPSPYLTRPGGPARVDTWTPGPWGGARPAAWSR